MKDRAQMIAVLATILATGAFAQAPAAPSDDYLYGDGAHGLSHLASYRIPETKAWDSKYRSSLPQSEVRTMPEYRVTEFRNPVFRERDIYTKVGMEDQSFKRHPGLVFGNAFNLNASLAYETFLRDDWNSTKSDYFAMAHAMALGGDPAEGHMILNAINDEDLRMRAEADDAASAPAIGRFQIASAETGTKLLELPEETIDIPFIKKTW
jgi:hypothetical protein